jgi:hypothetical protein
VNEIGCWMCDGWGYIHPLDTGENSHNGKPPFKREDPVYVWAASRGTHWPGDVQCPVCQGDGKSVPFNSAYSGDVLLLESEIW